VRYIYGQTVEKSFILAVFYSYIVYLGTSQELRLLCTLYAACTILNELERTLKKAQWRVWQLMWRYLLEKLKKAKRNLNKAVVIPIEILTWYIWDKLRRILVNYSTVERCWKTRK